MTDSKAIKRLWIGICRIESRATKIERLVREAINLLRDVSQKLCHLIRQQKEDFYGTGVRKRGNIS